jgi:hypothetical protein
VKPNNKGDLGQFKALITVTLGQNERFAKLAACFMSHGVEIL